MKKYLFLLIAVLSFGLTSCDDSDTDPGATAVVDMAGQWDVKVDAIDESGNILYEDPYGKGTITLLTFNTAANTDKEMWISDDGNFRNFKMKVAVDYPNRTFSAPEADYDAAGTGKAVITNGKVLKGKAVNLHGMPNDSIVFDIKFSDDDNGLTYRISGQRYTGFLQ